MFFEARRTSNLNSSSRTTISLLRKRGEGMEKVLSEGFEFVQMGRALLREPDFINRLAREASHHCGCEHVNDCIARMYSREMACHCRLADLPPKIIKEIERIKENG